MKASQEKLDYNRAYYLKNKERLKKQVAEYRRNNREKVNAMNLKYVAANRDRVNRWLARYRANNPGTVTAAENRRRALEIGATVDAESCKQFFKWVRNQDYVTCTYCGRFITGKSIEIDHIVPLTRGGRHEPDNFCVSCRSCNASKGDKLLSEWPKCPEKFKTN